MFRIVLLIFITLFSNVSLSEQKKQKTVPSDFFRIEKYDYVYGQETAPIEVFEYFSLTCPHCENFFVSIFPKIKTKYIDTGKVKWIKRSYAVDNSSQKGTLLLNCAGKEEYTKYLSVLLTKQASWAYQKDPLPVLKNIASLGGMSQDKFNKCQDDKFMIQDMRRVADEAKRVLNISGTPSFYVNGEKVTLYSYDAFELHFDKLLSGK